MSALSAAPIKPGRVLPDPFYDRSVHDVARDLIGCFLTVDGVGGMIVEVESYHEEEPACHAYVGRTARTEALFEAPGHAYVYLSYGIHKLLNVVAEPRGVGAAVLVRALEPLWGIDQMRARRGLTDGRMLCSGPGKLSQALGVDLQLNGRSLTAPPFELRGRSAGMAALAIESCPRIGITKAVELPWRFCAAGSAYLSRPVPRALAA